MDAADLKPRTYQEAGTHPTETRTITPPRATSLALYHAFSALQEATAALEKAEKGVPSYTAQWNPIDYYGAEEEAHNRAIDAFEDALVASVRIRTSHLSDGR